MILPHSTAFAPSSHLPGHFSLSCLPSGLLITFVPLLCEVNDVRCAESRILNLTILCNENFSQFRTPRQSLGSATRASSSGRRYQAAGKRAQPKSVPIGPRLPVSKKSMNGPTGNCSDSKSLRES